MSASAPNVILRGGPMQVADQSCTRYVDDTDSTLKLLVGNAYEHFQPTGQVVEHHGRHLRVFEWIRRTYIAE
ncbi:DUF5988 family protein [Streptomyces sparsogenes]|uniref:DUF5988 family protein n=1 Tax=Streptomyces sparsogenes TaxID=67365 RepID=UPI0033D74C80